MGKTEVVLHKNAILYIQMKRNVAEVYSFSGKVQTLRITLAELEQRLGDDFLKVSRSCLVSVMAIHDITDVIELTNAALWTIPRGTVRRSPPNGRQSGSR